MRYICPLCGEVYDEEDAGESFADLPENWTCPLCMAPKSSFRPEETTSGNDMAEGPASVSRTGG